jgi:heat shock protein HtpX
MYKQIDSNKSKTVWLMLFFLIFVVGLGYFLSWYFGNQMILVIAVIVSIVQALVSYYSSDKIALSISQAQEVERKEPYLEIHRLVENLAITAGIPKPKIYIINDTAPNAFATGRDPEHASIALTTGLLDKLDKSELEGVIAHEMSHIGNYDIRLMTMVVVLVGLISLLADFFLRWTWFGGGGRKSESSSDNGGQIQSILMIVGLALVILSPIIATAIQLAVSRKREYLADATGALLTRYPEGLASALEKISADQEPLEVANKATAHLYIASPLKTDTDEKKGGWSNLFETHPPIQDRIKKLRAMV